MSRQCEAKSHAFCPISGKSRATFAASLVFNLRAQLQTFPIYSKGLSGVSSDGTTVPASSNM